MWGKEEKNRGRSFTCGAATGHRSLDAQALLPPRHKIQAPSLLTPWFLIPWSSKRGKVV